MEYVVDDHDLGMDIDRIPPCSDRRNTYAELFSVIGLADDVSAHLGPRGQPMHALFHQPSAIRG